MVAARRSATSTDRGAAITPRQRYHALTDEVVRHYAHGRFADALAALRDRPAELSPWDSALAHLEACVRGVSGDDEGALRVLLAASDRGGWWDPAILDDDDLGGARSDPRFPALLATSRRRWTDANATDVRDRTGDLVVEPDGPARGLLVVLHGADEDVAPTLEAWAGALGAGFAVLAVRSGRLTCPGYRTWPDTGRALQEVDAAVAALPDRLRRLPVVAGGFSAGARVALSWALSGRPLPVAGAVLVAPATSVDRLEGLDGSTGALHPARILVGADDELAGDVVAVGESLRGRGFTTEVVRGLDHRLPGDWEERLVRALGEAD